MQSARDLRADRLDRGLHPGWAGKRVRPEPPASNTSPPSSTAPGGGRPGEPGRNWRPIRDGTAERPGRQYRPGSGRAATGTMTEVVRRLGQASWPMAQPTGGARLGASARYGGPGTDLARRGGGRPGAGGECRGPAASAPASTSNAYSARPASTNSPDPWAPAPQAGHMGVRTRTTAQAPRTSSGAASAPTTPSPAREGQLGSVQLTCCGRAARCSLQE